MKKASFLTGAKLMPFKIAAATEPPTSPIKTAIAL
ncbi:Uncharacterised protein [Listeria fleischmannii subsp. fleischmannii]|uniref:Uncharacterized protein n=1 Tax=Listeria fleischmannii subsp. fleischmannii TaxID=1671902 RepID=A0A2X3HAQ6_9LIST|nr:Uncharacterised protein [Listeria fleischmannii subsp. fleischmannii]